MDDGIMNWEYSVFVRMWLHVIHCSENVILAEFSSLVALEVVILTTSNDEKFSDENFVNMQTFSFQCY